MGFMKYVFPSGRTGRPRRSLNHEGAPGAARTTRREQELKVDAGVLAESYDIVSGELARLLLRVHKVQRLRVFCRLHRLLLPVYNLEANHERERERALNLWQFYGSVCSV